MGSLISLAAALLLFAAPPERISWMRPDAWHLSVGMKRAEAVAALRAWEPKPGANADQVVVDFDNDRAVTMQFANDRLVSIRFELYLALPQTRKAFEEAREHLQTTFGKAPKTTSSVVIYDDRLPNIFVAVTDDPASPQGKKGLGVVAVRYFDPRTPK